MLYLLLCTHIFAASISSLSTCNTSTKISILDNTFPIDEWTLNTAIKNVHPDVSPLPTYLPNTPLPLEWCDEILNTNHTTSEQASTHAPLNVFDYHQQKESTSSDLEENYLQHLLHLQSMLNATNPQKEATSDLEANPLQYLLHLQSTLNTTKPQEEPPSDLEAHPLQYLLHLQSMLNAIKSQEGIHTNPSSSAENLLPKADSEPFKPLLLLTKPTSTTSQQSRKGKTSVKRHPTAVQTIKPKGKRVHKKMPTHYDPKLLQNFMQENTLYQKSVYKKYNLTSPQNH